MAINIQNGSHVRVSDQWASPYNSAHDDAGETTYAGKSGVVQTQNTMGETLVQFDESGLGSYWIADEELTIIQPRRFTGTVPAPEVFSTLEGDMVPTGVDLYQCEICGHWMSRKMTPSEELQHDRNCRPVYEEAQ